MKTVSVNQNSYSVYQAFKAYREPDQRNKYMLYSVNHFWFLTNTKTEVFSKWDAPRPNCELTHKATYTLESIWQLTLAPGLKSFACYPQGQGKQVQKILLYLFSMCSFQKLCQSL